MAEALLEPIDAGWYRSTGRLGLSFWLPAAWICLLLLLAASADLWTLPAYDHIDWNHPAAPPGTRSQALLPSQKGGVIASSYTYWLGTDTLGRDIAVRLIHGARVSLLVGLLAPAIACIIGGALGILAGYYRGRFEALVVAAMDTILAFPGLVLLLAIGFYLGPGLQNLIPALAILIVPAFCRVARANTLTWAERDFIMAARAIGAGNRRIIFCHILPNVIWPLSAYGLLLVGVMIVVEGALSFLGLGVPAPTPSWGGMIAAGKEVLDDAPHVALVPAAVMFITVLSFNILGDRMRELTDIRNHRGAA
jgi:peptide/nickel transport system permease protein